MTREEKEAAYKAIDFGAINAKKADTMLDIVRTTEIEGADVDLFHKVKERFTVDELAYIACVTIGLETREVLEKNPGNIREMAHLLRRADEISKKIEKNG